MPNALTNLTIKEVSLVDRPSNSEHGIPRARVALWKRDDSEGEELAKAVDGKMQSGMTYPASDFAYAPNKDAPSSWKLRMTKTPGGSPDVGIVGAAIAALGKGFRGNKVQIPAEALPGVKAKVRTAWKKANPDKGEDEMPDVLKITKGETKEMPAMTLEEIEKKVTDQDIVLKGLLNENEVLKIENELVVKMSKKERKAYAGMTEEKRKEYVASDATKRKSMMDDCMTAKMEKRAVECMDDSTRGEYEKAGPEKRKALLAKSLETLIKAAKKKAMPPNEEEDEDEEDDQQDETNKRLVIKVAESEDRVTKVEAELALVRKRERLITFTKMAEDKLPHTAGSPVEKGSLLMELADSLKGGEAGDAFKKVLGNMEDADKTVAKHFGEVGKVGGGEIPAEKALEAKAQEISKRDKLDLSHAMEKACMESPELYYDYERQHRQYAARQ